MAYRQVQDKEDYNQVLNLGKRFMRAAQAEHNAKVEADNNVLAKWNANEGAALRDKVLAEMPDLGHMGEEIKQVCDRQANVLRFVEKTDNTTDIAMAALTHGNITKTMRVMLSKSGH